MKFLLLLGAMSMALMFMIGLKVLSIAGLVLMLYWFNSFKDNEPVSEDLFVYGATPDYKSYNRDEDYLDD